MLDFCISKVVSSLWEVEWLYEKLWLIIIYVAKKPDTLLQNSQVD